MLTFDFSGIDAVGLAQMPDIRFAGAEGYTDSDLPASFAS
jgi:hypothetical protein